MYGGGADYDAYDPFAEVADYEPFQEEEEAGEGEQKDRSGLSGDNQRGACDATLVDGGIRVDSVLVESNTSSGDKAVTFDVQVDGSASSDLSIEVSHSLVGHKRPLDSDMPEEASNNGRAAGDPHAHRSAVPVVTPADRALWKDCWRVVLKRLGKFSREGRIAAGDVDRLGKKLAQKVFEKERCRERRKAAAEAEAEAVWRMGLGPGVTSSILTSSYSASHIPNTSSSSTDASISGETAPSRAADTGVVVTESSSACTNGAVGERSSLDEAGELRVREYVKAYFDKFGSYSSSASGPLWRK
jgi:hypothetical protein